MVLDKHLQLQGMPAGLNYPTDAALIVQEQMLPVHGLLLAVHSKVLAQALVSSEPSELPKVIPLTEDTIETVGQLLQVLDYIYRSASWPGNSASFTSRQQAVCVAQFARKYDAPTLSADAEAYLQDQVESLYFGQCFSKGGLKDDASHDTSGHPQLASPEKLTTWNEIDMLAFASQMHLSRLEQTCLEKLTDIKGSYKESLLESDDRLQHLSLELE